MRDWTGIPYWEVTKDRLIKNQGDIDYFLRDLSAGMSRIQKGLVPDGSGDTIINQIISDLYFYLPGREGGQLGHFDTDSAGSGTLSSTRHPTKGKIYLGTAKQTAYDEANERIGINQPTPTAKLNIKVPEAVDTFVRPSADVAPEPGLDWNKTNAGEDRYEHINDSDDASALTWTSNLGTSNNVVSLTPSSDPGETSDFQFKLKLRSDLTQTNARMKFRLTNEPAGTEIFEVFYGGPSNTATPSEGNVSGTYTEYTYNLTAGEIAAIDFGATTWDLDIIFSGVANESGKVFEVSNAVLDVPPAGGASAETVLKWEDSDNSAQFDVAADEDSNTVTKVSGDIGFLYDMGNDVTPIKIKAHSTQTNPLTEWLDSSDVFLGSMDGSGNFKAQTVILDGATAEITNDVAAGGSSHTLTWPSSQGAANSILVNDGSGGLSWSTSPTLEVQDESFTIVDNAFGARKAQFECTNLPTGTNEFIFPAISGFQDTLAVLGIPQTFTRAITIDGSADEDQLVVQGDTSQTNPLVVFQQGSGQTGNMVSVLDSGATPTLLIQASGKLITTDFQHNESAAANALLESIDTNGNVQWTTTPTIGSGSVISVFDDDFTIIDDGNAGTLQFVLDNISASQARTWTVQDLSGTPGLIDNDQTVTGQWDFPGPASRPRFIDTFEIHGPVPGDYTGTHVVVAYDSSPTATTAVTIPGVAVSGIFNITGSGSDPASGTRAIATVNRVGQTSDIASPIKLTDSAKAGVYMVWGYMECSTADAGGAPVSLNLTWTDSVGSKTVGLASVDTTSTSNVGNGFQQVYVSSGDITWGTSGYAAGAYTVRIRVGYLGF